MPRLPISTVASWPGVGPGDITLRWEIAVCSAASFPPPNLKALLNSLKQAQIGHWRDRHYRVHQCHVDRRSFRVERTPSPGAPSEDGRVAPVPACVPCLANLAPRPSEAAPPEGRRALQRGAAVLTPHSSRPPGYSVKAMSPKLRQLMA
jgi:hypothetical protein